MNRFDAIVIGTGQAGPSLAGRLTAAGMTVAVIERKLVGGTCVNTGCTPTKTLVASAQAAYTARRAGDYGVIVEGTVRVDMAKFKARADTVAGNSRAGLDGWLRSMKGCTLIEGHARFEAPDRLRVKDDVLTAPRIFSNVGGRPSVPPLPGINEVPFLTNRTMLELDQVPEHLSWAAATLASRSPRCTGASGQGSRSSSGSLI
jgi:pyruvate/2-oxoglutarate dehydrogenase complex dihydrolipoamide dehydrogenase (E3) component